MVLMGLILGGSGCAHVYQPMSGLNTPVLVDPTQPNFRDLSLTVHCVPTDGMSDMNRRTLCRRVGALFENQGAQIEIIDGQGRGNGGFSFVDEDPEEEPRETDLILELRARRIPVDQHGESWALFTLSLTLLPGIVESPFAIDVTVRDGGGFLLSEEFLEGRVVAKYGVAPWVTATLANQTWRRGAEKASARAAGERLSEDFYGQLSQLVYNAKLQWQVLSASVAEEG